MTTNYRDWFLRLTGFEPHAWQRELGDDIEFRDRLLRLPTGFGSSMATCSAEEK